MKPPRYNINHPTRPLTWGEAFTAPIEWDENDIPSIDADYLKERGFR